MPINDVVLRTAKELYERRAFDSGKTQLHEYLFPNEDTDLAAGFSLDKLIQNTYGIRYTIGQAAVRAYQPGSSTVIVPPLAGEQTPITGDLLDSVVRGSEAVEGFDANKAKLVGNIVGDHYDAFTMTKNYQALRVLADGEFVATGEQGSDIGLDLDYGRAAGNDLTFDFTSGTPSYADGVTEAIDLLLENGAQEIMAIAGKNWRKQFSTDAGVLKYMESNASNTLLIQPMIEEINGVQGLRAMGQYRPAEIAVPCMYASYQPGAKYKSHEGATAVDFVGDDEIIFFGMTAPRYTVNRGIDIINESGEMDREAGALVFDRFFSPNPVGQFMRTQTRHCFVPADVAQTVKVTGTFA